MNARTLRFALSILLCTHLSVKRVVHNARARARKGRLYFPQTL